MRSPYDGLSRVALRAGLAAVGAVDVVESGWFVATRAPSEASNPRAPAALLAFGASPELVAPVVLVGLGALLCFALARWTLASGVAALASLALLNESYAALSPGPMHHLFFSGAMLLGWIAGAAYARSLFAPSGPGRDVEESYAEVGAVGVLATIYFSAGCSKLLHGGLGWSHGLALRLAILSQMRVSGSQLTTPIARLVVETPWIANAMSAGTLVLQLGAPLLLVGPRVRAAWAAMLVCFHVGVAVVAGFAYVEATALLALFGVPWPRLAARGRSRSAGSPVPEPRQNERTVFTAAMLVLAVVAALAFSPLRQYALRSP